MYHDVQNIITGSAGNEVAPSLDEVSDGGPGAVRWPQRRDHGRSRVGVITVKRGKNGKARFVPIKARMGATHFLMKTLPKVAAAMALHVLAYNLTRAMNIVGIKPFLAAIRA